MSVSQSAENIDLAARRQAPTLTITVPSNEELRSTSSPESVSPMVSSQNLDYTSTGDRSGDDVDSPKTPSRYIKDPSNSRNRLSKNAARYQGINNGQRVSSTKRLQRHDSKWNKVKRAFLKSASSMPPSPSSSSRFFNGKFSNKVFLSILTVKCKIQMDKNIILFFWVFYHYYYPYSLNI